MKIDVQFPENCREIDVDFVDVTTVRGATFIPSVSEDGVISWTNNQDLQNPAPVNIKGAKGDPGEPGKDGKDGYTPVKGIDYFYPVEKIEMVKDVLAALPTWTGGSY